MANAIRSIAIDKLVAHPDNPNRMSKSNFAKLVRNIKRSGRYEPLVVRPHKTQTGHFEIINGHHRRDALAKLGYETARCLVWDVDDGETDILLATLNRLGGSDEPGKRIALLNRLAERAESTQLAKLLPHTAKQIEQLTKLAGRRITLLSEAQSNSQCLAEPLVFFVSDEQKLIIARALSLAQETSQKTKAARRAAALTAIAKRFCQGAKPTEQTKVTFRED